MRSDGGGVGSGGRVSRQVASLMDLFPTILSMSGIPVPEGLVLDGIDLAEVIREERGSEEEEGEVEKTFDRPIFHYRGNELFAVRMGLYKAHLWTWTNGKSNGISF